MLGLLVVIGKHENFEEKEQNNSSCPVLLLFL